MNEIEEWSREWIMNELMNERTNNPCPTKKSKSYNQFKLDDYVEAPILLQKMANSASSTQCTNNR